MSRRSHPRPEIEAWYMPKKMAGVSILGVHMPGVRFIVPTTTKNVDVAFSVSLVFGVPLKILEIMPSRCGG
jgi:hypothetical protein